MNILCQILLKTGRQCKCGVKAVLKQLTKENMRKKKEREMRGERMLCTSEKSFIENIYPVTITYSPTLGQYALENFYK